MIHQLDQATFSKNVFWSVNFVLSFCQTCYVQKSTLRPVQMLTLVLKGCKHCKKFQEKSRDQIHDVIL